MLAKTKMLGLMLAAAVAFASPKVYADNAGAAPVNDKDAPHQAGNWHQDHEDNMMAKILNLSDDQVKQLKDAHEKQKAAMKSNVEQMKSNREAFDAEIIKAAPDMSKVNAIQVQLKTVQAQMLDDRLNSILAVKKILTPEQFAGYMALEKARKLMMHHEGHHGFGRKDEPCKMGDARQHGNDHADEDHGPDSQD